MVDPRNDRLTLSWESLSYLAPSDQKIVPEYDYELRSDESIVRGGQTTDTMITLHDLQCNKAYAFTVAIRVNATSTITTSAFVARTTIPGKYKIPY